MNCRVQWVKHWQPNPIEILFATYCQSVLGGELLNISYVFILHCGDKLIFCLSVCLSLSLDQNCYKLAVYLYFWAPPMAFSPTQCCWMKREVVFFWEPGITSTCLTLTIWPEVPERYTMLRTYSIEGSKLWFQGRKIILFEFSATN